MTLPSLRKLRITQRNTLPTTAFNARRRLFGSLVALSAMAGGSLFAEVPLQKQIEQRQAEQKQAEQAAAARWQELREHYWSAASTAERTASPLPRRFPDRTTLEQVAADSFLTAKTDERLSASSSKRNPNRIEPVSGNREPGNRVVHSFSDSTEPLARPVFELAQLVSLPEFLAMEQRTLDGAVALQPVPPEPIPASQSDSSLPSPGAQLSDPEDTLFQPITRIQPYQNYSPSAAAQGKVRYDYICPQPDQVPADQRASCPDILALPRQGSTDRNFATTQYCWVATDLFHNPLYFEDVALERYGQHYPYGIQPFVSLGRFGIQFLGIPYQMALDPVHREIYALGYYRPGDCAPELEYRIPFNAKAAATAAGVYTGFAFLIP